MSAPERDLAHPSREAATALTTFPRAPTLADVGARAGVSHQTVSRVINHAAGVRESTRVRVITAINELGYRPNVAAKTLASRRQNAIGVLAPTVADYGPTSVVHALEVAAAEVGFRTLETRALDSADSARAALQALLDQAVAGVIVVASSVAANQAVADFPTAVPILRLWPGVSTRPAVYIDQAAGIRAAFGHLVGLGHRYIQHLAGPLSHIEARLRADAFALQCRLAGVPELDVLRGDWSAGSGSAAAAHRDSRATALVCGNDQMALGALAALRRERVSVPGRVSVVGFDDIPESAFFAPALTTVAQDFTRLGSLALDQLVEVISTGSAASISIQPTLVIRDSTHPAWRATQHFSAG